MLRAPMKLHPRPSLAATGDHTSGQAARLRDRLLPFQLSRPSAPSALATPWVLIRMLCIGATTTILHLVLATITNAARGLGGKTALCAMQGRSATPHASGFPRCARQLLPTGVGSSSAQPHRPHKPPARVRARDMCGARPRKAKRTGSGPQRAPPGRQMGYEKTGT